MKTHTEILEKHKLIDERGILPECIFFKDILFSMQEVENQTREEMFEFLKWIVDHRYPFIRRNNNWIRYDTGNVIYSDQELFDYWKSLNK